MMTVWSCFFLFALVQEKKLLMNESKANTSYRENDQCHCITRSAGPFILRVLSSLQEIQPRKDIRTFAECTMEYLNISNNIITAADSKSNLGEYVNMIL